MINLKQILTNQFEKLSFAVKKFYLPFYLILALFFLNVYDILANIDLKFQESFSHAHLAIFLGIVTGILSSVICEKFAFVFSKQVACNILVLLMGIGCYTFLNYSSVSYFAQVAVWGIIFSEVILIFYFSKAESISAAFSHFLKSILFNVFVCGIVLCGTAICIFAFNSLIYDFANISKVYSVLISFVGIVLFLTMMLLSIPKLGQKLMVPNVFKIIVYKVMLPIYIILLCILYIYLSKILLTLTFPSGQVNWFVSFSSFLFVFFAFSLTQYKVESKFINLFLKFGGLAVIPTIIMQFVAIYIRVSAYGLTTLRYSSIAFNIFALIFSILFLLQQEKFLKPSLFILIGFILSLTVTPINIIDTPKYQQAHRLKTLLSKNNMFVNNSIVPNNNLSQEVKIQILESYKYLRKNFSSSIYNPDFIDPNRFSKSEKEIFGFEESEMNVYNQYIDFAYKYSFTDISEYSKLYELSSSNFKLQNNEFVIIEDENTYTLTGLHNYLNEIYESYSEKAPNKVIENEKIEFTFKQGKIVLYNIQMYKNKKSNELEVKLYNSCYFLKKLI